jgi:Ca2+-transporting ATPase
MSAARTEGKALEGYLQSADEVLAALGTDARQGLSRDEARARLDTYGKNELTGEKPAPAWKKFIAHFMIRLYYFFWPRGRDFGRSVVR